MGTIAGTYFSGVFVNGGVQWDFGGATGFADVSALQMAAETDPFAMTDDDIAIISLPGSERVDGRMQIFSSPDVTGLLTAGSGTGGTGENNSGAHEMAFAVFWKGFGEREREYLSKVFNASVAALEAGLKDDSDARIYFAIKLVEHLLEPVCSGIWTRGVPWLLPRCTEAGIFLHALGWLRGAVKGIDVNDEQRGRIEKSLGSKKDAIERLEGLLTRAVAEAIIPHPEKVIPEIDIPVFAVEGDESRRSSFFGKGLINAVLEAGGRIVDRSCDGDCMAWFNSQRGTEFKDFDSLFNDMLKKGAAVRRESAKTGDAVVYLKFMGTHDDFVTSVFGSKDAGDYLNINGRIFTWRHVGIVSRVEGGDIWIRSKWGWGNPVLETRVDDVSAVYGNHMIFMRSASAETAKETVKEGLDRIRSIAQHSQSAAELDVLARNPHIINDPAVQRHLLKNPVTPPHVLVRIFQTMNMFDLYNIIGGHEVNEPAKKSAREQLGVKFRRASAVECAQFIIRTEGRGLQYLMKERFTRETTDELCKHDITSLVLVGNLTIFSALPPALIRHLLKQPIVQRNKVMKSRFLKHANCPADARHKEETGNRF